MNPLSQATSENRATGLRDTAAEVLKLMRVSNPYGTLLLLFPSLWALVLAGAGHPPAALVAIFVIGAFLMRSAGCIINDVADRGIDPLVARTRSRPLASGRLTVRTALAAFVMLVGLSFLLIAHLNRLTILLSAAGLGLAVLYPFTKRFVSIPQAFLGMAFGWGTFMAWAAVTGELALTPALLFFATICWAIAYDTIYAIQDVEDDRRVGVRSSAILFGEASWAWVVAFLAGTLALLGAAGLREGLGVIYFAALSGCGVYFAYQGMRVRAGLSREQAFGLFRAHAWVGAAVLAAMWTDRLAGTA